ncbi:MAG: hypothetical protein KDC05_03605 [Bacteroidales bacterium]|nr:hypothetical protein [Bacteroidales bacterium]
MTTQNSKSKTLKAFGDILNDKTSGSAAILNNVISVFQELTSEQVSPDFAQLIHLLNRLKDAFGNFAVVYHFVSRAMDLLKAGDIENLRAFLQHYKKEWKDAVRQTAAHMSDHIKDHQFNSVLIHSNSSAIYAFCEELTEHGRFPVLYQTFSGPAGEGRNQVSQAIMKDFEIHFFHENAASRFIHDIDIALFGADIITDQYVVNKAGTYPLALLCREFNIPVYVLVDSRKFIYEENTPTADFNQLITEKVKNPRELWPNPPANVKVVNYYFEKMPLSLVSAVISEKGIIYENGRWKTNF